MHTELDRFLALEDRLIRGKRVTEKALQLTLDGLRAAPTDLLEADLRAAFVARGRRVPPLQPQERWSFADREHVRTPHTHAELISAAGELFARPVGRGHGGELYGPNEVLIDLRHFDQVEPVADARFGVDTGRLIRAGAGITLERLAAILAADELAVETMGGALSQSLAGAINTGQHGPGQAPLADAVRSVDLVLDGRIHRYEPTIGITDPAHCTFVLHQDDAAFEAMVVSRGTLGITVAYTLEVCDQFHVRETAAPFALEQLPELIAEIKKQLASNDPKEQVGARVALEILPEEGRPAVLHRYQPRSREKTSERRWTRPRERRHHWLGSVRSTFGPQVSWLFDLTPGLLRLQLGRELERDRTSSFSSVAHRVVTKPSIPGLVTERVTVPLDDLERTLEPLLAQANLFPVRVSFAAPSRHALLRTTAAATITVTLPWHQRDALELAPAAPHPVNFRAQQALHGASAGNPADLQELILRGRERPLDDEEARRLVEAMHEDPGSFQEVIRDVTPEPGSARGNVWHDWLGGHRVKVDPQKPANLGALRLLLGQTTGRKIRIHGEHHADNWVSPPDRHAVAVDLKETWPEPPHGQLDTWEVGGKKYARAWGWESLANFFDRLDHAGLAVLNTGSFSGQSIAGPLAMGTHGSGRHLGAMCDTVVSVDILCADGQVRRIRADHCPAPLASVILPMALGAYFPHFQQIPLDLGVVNLGCFGVLLAFVVEVRDAYRLTQLTQTLPLNDAIDVALASLDTFPHVEMVVVPEPVEIDGAVVQATVIQRRKPERNDPTNTKPPLPAIIRALAGARWLLRPLAEIVQTTHFVRQEVFKGSLNAQQPFQDTWRETLLRNTGIAAHSFEIHVPLPHTRKALKAVLEAIRISSDVDGINPTAPAGVRFVKSGSQAMAMNHGELFGESVDAWCTIELPRLYGSFHPDNIPRRVLQQLNHFDVPFRVHWGQYFPESVDLEPRYPKLADWLTVRNALDPTGRFFPTAVEAKLTNSRSLGAPRAAGEANQRRVLLIAGIPGESWQPSWRQALSNALSTRNLTEPVVHVLGFDDLFDGVRVDRGTQRSSLLDAFGEGSRYRTARTSPRNWLDALPQSAAWAPDRTGTWLSQLAVRDAVRRRIWAALAQFEPDVVVGHGLGSLFAYDTLSYAPTRAPRRVDLVTLGGAVSGRGMRRRWGGTVSLPPNIRHWFHVHHRDDPYFAGAIGLAEMHDIELSEETEAPASAEAYLSSPTVTRDVWNVVLGDAPPKSRLRLSSRRQARVPRRALLVGINHYLDPGFTNLQGCVNDVISMSELLQSRYGYHAKDIRILTDERATTARLKDRLQWLLDGTTSLDRRLFYFSGHGTQLPAYNAHEVIDRVDECLVTHDFDWNQPHSAFVDDDFMELYSQLPRESRFTAIFDCCHAAGLSRAGGGQVRGVALPEDVLHRVMQFTRGKWRLRDPEERQRAIRQPREDRLVQGFVGGAQALRAPTSLIDANPALRGHGGPFLPVLLYATQERDLAYEYRDGRRVQGAFTWALTKILRKQPNASFADLLAQVQEQVARVSGNQTPDLEGPTQRIGAERQEPFSV